MQTISCYDYRTKKRKKVKTKEPNKYAIYFYEVSASLKLLHQRAGESSLIFFPVSHKKQPTGSRGTSCIDRSNFINWTHGQDALLTVNNTTEFDTRRMKRTFCETWSQRTVTQSHSHGHSCVRLSSCTLSIDVALHCMHHSNSTVNRSRTNDLTQPKASQLPSSSSCSMKPALLSATAPPELTSAVTDSLKPTTAEVSATATETDS